MKKILIGGSPCTYWSIAQKNRETEASGQGWDLFLNYLIAKEKFKPDFFIYENNHSISKEIKAKITEMLGVQSETINSSTFSAQRRIREYWHNSENKANTQDAGILLQNVLESGIAEREKAYCLDATYYKGGNLKNYLIKHRRTQVFEVEPNGRPPVYVKDGITKIEGREIKVNLPDGTYYNRNLTVNEAARLQTMPDDYCKAVSRTEALKCYGNGWTAKVIMDIMQRLLESVPKSEEIAVLSMYDGIATGRYCLEKLGFTNIKYYAYEIDKPAITVALDNYPDIIELGDVFQVREDNWSLSSIALEGNK